MRCKSRALLCAALAMLSKMLLLCAALAMLSKMLLLCAALAARCALQERGAARSVATGVALE